MPFILPTHQGRGAEHLLFNALLNRDKKPVIPGHGHFDMSSYDRYFAGELEDYDYPEQAIKDSLAHLPDF